MSRGRANGDGRWMREDESKIVTTHPSSFVSRPSSILLPISSVIIYPLLHPQPQKRNEAECGDDDTRDPVDPPHVRASVPCPKETDAKGQDKPPERGAEKYAQDQYLGGDIIRASICQAEPCKYRPKGNDGRRVGKGQKKSRGIGAGMVASPAPRGGIRGVRKKSPDAKRADEQPPGQSEPCLLIEQNVRDKFKAKCRDGAVDRVGCRRAQA